MSEERQKHVHFMGILGSGCASIAMLACEAGYRVSGCDSQTDSYYADELRKKGVRIYQGHDPAHLQDVDITAVTPALFDISPDNPELLLAREKGILMTWQEFMGRYLQKDRRVACIAGTHGKTTTTFLTAELLIGAGLDPTIEGGSVYKKWGIGARSGKSDIFVCEADEFNRNFYHYTPEIAVLTNVEMDHPECYHSYEEMLDAYRHFVAEGGKLKTLILNGDSSGAVEVLRMCAPDPRLSDVRVIAFMREDRDFGDIPLKIEKALYRTVSKSFEGTEFSINCDGQEQLYSMKLYGEYNVSNAVAAILAARAFGASEDSIREPLRSFTGVGRRFDPVGKMGDIPVFDDYAHHPTEIAAVLSMCRDYFPGEKIAAVFEPHQISRLTLMFDEYVSSLAIADHVIIGKTHIGREIRKQVKPISKERWESASPKIRYEEDKDRIKEILTDYSAAGECSMILVIGAANSYKLSRYLLTEEGKEESV